MYLCLSAYVLFSYFTHYNVSEFSLSSLLTYYYQIRYNVRNINIVNYLTPVARDETRGKKAVSDLEEEGLKPLYHQLDICNAESREKLAKFIKENYGGLDVLVNNAGIAYKVIR